MLQAEKKFYRASEVWASGFKTIVIRDLNGKHLIVAGCMFIAESDFTGRFNTKIVHSEYCNGSMFEELEKLRKIYFKGN